MWDRKMKALFFGMSVATVIGLSAGGVMKPLSGDFEGGPQLSFAPPARHVPHPWAEAADWTNYGANIPEYVIGTDWIAPQLAVASAAEAQEAEPPPAPPVKAAPPLPAPPQLEERPAPEQHYPSLGGDILAGMDSYAPPTPPQDEPPQPPPAN